MLAARTPAVAGSPRGTCENHNKLVTSLNLVSAVRRRSTAPFQSKPQHSRAVCRSSIIIPGRGMPGSGPAAGASPAQQPAAGPPKIGVLFVCLGNICRSPTAEAVFKAVVERAGVADKFDIDSCGTGGGNPDWFTEGGWSYHEGDAADPRMTVTAKRRGVFLTSRSRPLQPLDLTRFDYIIGMDGNNLRAIKTAADYWLVRPMGQGKVPADYSKRISLMTSYCVKFKGASEVPDPYYGGPEGFERVLDLLDDACVGLLDKIRAERGI